MNTLALIFLLIIFFFASFIIGLVTAFLVSKKEKENENRKNSI